MTIGIDCKKIYMEDTTLRDGEQAPSVNYSINEKIDIALKLSEILSEDDAIDAGFPAISEIEAKSIIEISKLVTKNTIGVISRLKESDIDLARETLRYAKKGKLGLMIPTSPQHRKYKLQVSKEELMESAIKAIRYGKKYFDDVEVGFEDGSRTELDFLYELTERVINEGITSITLADTLGCLTPWETGELFTNIRNNVTNIDKLKIFGVHFHNDMGLALANSLEAVRNGANKIACTFNGIGERTGNVSTEELLLLFMLKPDIIKNTNRDKYNYKKIIECSKLVSKYSTIEVQKTKPVVGEFCYLHESGIHQDGILKDKSTYQLFDPSLIGYEGEIFSVGKHSGRNGLKHKLEKMNINPNTVDFREFFKEFKLHFEKNKQIYDEDIINIAEHSLK
jgi:2-isopropylmalate synthase